MKIDPNQPMQLLREPQPISAFEQSGAPFTQLLTHSISTTNSQLLAADQALQNLASGQATSLHETMLTLEEAKLSLQYLEQIRNRLMSAWQDLLREQI